MCIGKIKKNMEEIWMKYKRISKKKKLILIIYDVRLIENENMLENML